jgi:hypothetical protein
MADPNERNSVAEQETTSEMSEAEIDQNLEDTFPASDPPSWTLGTAHGEDIANQARDADHQGDQRDD